MKKLFSFIAVLFISYASFGLGPISGTLGCCVGSSAYLSDSTYSGTWSSSDPSIASCDSIGIVNGISAGTCTITFTSGSSYVTATFLVTAAPAAIAGPSSVCIGSNITLSDATFGGVWSSLYSYATVGASTGVVTGVSTGVDYIRYTVGLGCFAQAPVSVGGAGTVAAISGVSTLCAGSTSTFTDATSGGTWSSSSTSIATVGAATGVVTGVAGGTVVISYTVPGTCGSVTVTRTLTITTTTYIGPIMGATTLCVGSTTTYTDSTTSGGAWSSSDVSIATVSSGGVVTGVADGTCTISYTVSGVCGGPITVVRTITIISSISAGTISGTSTTYVGGSTSLTDGVSGGTWSSSDPSVATVSSGGVVTGIATGTATITYTVSGCGTAYTTYVITVGAFSGISGHVNFSGGYYGSVKVWLITYNSGTHILAAVDSTTISCSGTSVYYDFPVEPTDSYRIKAAVVFDSSTTGFIPTYHTSNFYWYAATVLGHVSGTADINQDINMAYGTVTSGPGFVGGDVTTGANRGTSGSLAAPGVLMVCETSTGSVVQKTVTDATGAYSFTNLALGTYTIHPELLNYVSTDYTSIALTAAVPHASASNFIQHTVSHTITPGTTGVVTVNPSESSVVTFPNPTNGKLNIQWTETANENGTVSISDITGREVYKTTLNMNQGTGVNQVDLSGLTNGLYIISVKSGDINYNNKIQVRH